ncbi:PhaM family polyhydroxyalkanoate granule multifunctional regulatory protein [Variovorax sp. RHLX14]|uniref:PhaM family polyhydroxyalkanoate granule multifunctional regulatory protein n=1 Tax=Variovorax sp. RHLX14 TaxID=1259731 RepID=UPI003F469B88
MSDATPPFAFSQFVPGFDFLKNLADAAAATTAKNPAAGGIAGAAAGALPGMPSLSSWVAPTISVEEVDKRIQELKTVQYWLEQNGHALKATIQALEVQKMTLSTLRGMNVRMEDLASAFTRHATASASSAPAAPAAPTMPAASAWASSPAPAPSAPAQAESDADAGDASGDASPGVVDPMQWWNALTDQFQQIATSAIHDAAQIKMPVMPVMPTSQKPSTAAAARKKLASKTGGKTAAKPTAKATAPRKRTRGA